MRSVAVGGTAKRRIIHRAAKKLTAIIAGVSINSAVRVPRRGTTSRTRIVPKHESGPEDESEIEHGRFENLHCQLAKRNIGETSDRALASRIDSPCGLKATANPGDNFSCPLLLNTNISEYSFGIWL